MDKLYGCVQVGSFSRPDLDGLLRAESFFSWENSGPDQDGPEGIIHIRNVPTKNHVNAYPQGVNLFARNWRISP